MNGSKDAAHRLTDERNWKLKMKKIGMATVAAVTLCGAVKAEITEFRDSMAYAEEGFGVRRNFYQSGRISVKVADIAGIFEVNYIGRQPHTARRFYSSNENCSWGHFLVPQVIVDGVRYRLEYRSTTHYPFGYRSECTLGGVRLRHELVLDANAIFRRITVLDNPKGVDVRAVAVQMNPGMNGVTLRMNAARNGLEGERTDDGVTTMLRIGSANPAALPLNDRPLNSLAFKREGGTLGCRFDLIENSSAKEHLFYAVFDPKEGEDLSSARVDRVFAGFESRHANDARFATGNAVLDGTLGAIAPFSEMFEVDGCGAFRASPTYWVWGWDAMVHAGILSLVGRADEVRRMLGFFRDAADPSRGILHAYPTAISADGVAKSGNGSVMPGESFTLPYGVQLFYVILLHDYVALTGDSAAKAELLPFARSLVERARASVKGGGHLLRLYGFFPDNPYAVGHRLDDISLINNAIYLQGLRAWAAMSGEGAAEADAVERELVAKLWDGREGWWSDSWDVANGVRRPHYPLYGCFRVSPFGDDPAPSPVQARAAYLKSHFLNGNFLAMFAPGTASHLSDGNQLGSYYPVTDRSYWWTMNAAGRTDALADWRQILTSHGRVLTYPEGQTSDVVNNDPATGSDELGNKQFFAMKGWLTDAFELNFGMRWDEKGLAFHAIGDGTPFAAENLTVRGKSLTIRRVGSGTSATYVLNGARLDGSFVPYEKLAARNVLEIACSAAHP